MLQRISKLLLINKSEKQQVLYFLVLFFFVGAGMALGRGSSEALFFKRYGIEYLPLMYLITSVSLCVVSLVYAAFVDRLPSEKFYKILFVLLALLLLGNWLAISYSSTELVYPAFFLLYEIASELLLIHCAVYINQNLVQTQSKRLIPIILAGHQIGIISGGLLLAGLAPHLGVKNMMLIWIVLLLISYLIITYWHSNKGISPYFRAGRKGKSKLTESINQVTYGIKLMKTSRLLRVSSFSLFFMVISVYVLAYAVNSIYTESFETEESLTSFFGLLTATTGFLALLIQLFLTNRLIRDMGIKRVNYIFPLTSILSYTSLLFAFALPSAIIGSFNKETLMPAFAKPVRNIFNASLPTQAQGRAQAMTVILVIPLGLAFAGLFLMVAQNIDNINNILIIGLLCTVAYLFFNRKMNKCYASEILSNLKKRLFIPETNVSSSFTKNDWVKDIERGVMDDDSNNSLVYARALSKAEPEMAENLIPERMDKADDTVKDRMIKVLQPVESDRLKEYLKKELGTGDTHLEATLLKALFQSRDAEQQKEVALLLNNENPRMKATGIYGSLRYPVPELVEKAVSEWIGLLNSKHVNNYMPAVELLVPELTEIYQMSPLITPVKNRISDMLHQQDFRFIRIALDILATWPAGSFEDIEGVILKLSGDDDWIIRKACIKASVVLSRHKRDTLMLSAMEDSHPNVRVSAIQNLALNHDDEIAYIYDLLISKHSGSPKAQKTMVEYLMEIGCDSTTMQAVSVSLAKDAKNTKAASLFLKKAYRHDKSNAVILIHALEERVIEIADISLLAMQSSLHDEALAVIRAGLRSTDERQFSNACELLSMINNKNVSVLLLSIFDDSAAISKDNVLFDDVNMLVSWVQDRTDPWLTECVNFFSRSLDENHV